MTYFRKDIVKISELRRLIMPAIISLILVACTLGGAQDRPAIEIQSPANSTTVAVGAPVILSAIAADPNGPGVIRVELFVDGESVQSDQSPSGPQKVLDVAQVWTPEVEGEYELTIIAYREDDTPSRPDEITIEVVGLTLDPSQTPTIVLPSTGEAPSSDTLGTQTPEAVYVQAEVLVLSNLRVGPGPICDIVGSIRTGSTINLLETSGDGLWLKTDALGNGRTAWIFNGSLRFLDPRESVPQGNQFGCAGCGDNACNLDETCDSCPQDCGECCGNNICDTEFGEDCGTCEGDCGACCGNDVCEPGRGEDCASCSTDCGTCCGNGLCEADRSETCSTCSTDCGTCCGNGLCEANRDETCETCEADCGVCEPEETETPTAAATDDLTETPTEEETEIATEVVTETPTDEPTEEAPPTDEATAEVEETEAAEETD